MTVQVIITNVPGFYLPLFIPNDLDSDVLSSLVVMGFDHLTK